MTARASPCAGRLPRNVDVEDSKTKTSRLPASPVRLCSSGHTVCEQQPQHSPILWRDPASTRVSGTAHGRDDARFEAMFSQPTDPSLNYLPDSLGLSDDFFMPATLSAAQTGPHVSSVPSCDYSDLGRAASPYVTGLSPRSNDPTPKPGGDGSPGSNNSSDTLQKDTDSPVQQLSRLDYELVTLLTSLGKGRPHVTMDTLVSPIHNSKSSKPAVDEKLNRTREFVDVLETISEHRTSSTTAWLGFPKSPPSVARIHRTRAMGVAKRTAIHLQTLRRNPWFPQHLHCLPSPMHVPQQRWTQPLCLPFLLFTYVWCGYIW